MNRRCMWVDGYGEICAISHGSRIHERCTNSACGHDDEACHRFVSRDDYDAAILQARDAEWQSRLDALEAECDRRVAGLTAEVCDWAERAALAERRGYERGLRAATEICRSDKRWLCGECGWSNSVARGGCENCHEHCDDRCGPDTRGDAHATAIEALIGKPEGT